MLPKPCRHRGSDVYHSVLGEFTPVASPLFVIYCIPVAVARGLTSSQRGKTCTLVCQTEDVEVDIALSQVDRVVRKRPDVELGDVGYRNHDADAKSRASLHLSK